MLAVLPEGTPVAFPLKVQQVVLKQVVQHVVEKLAVEKVPELAVSAEAVADFQQKVQQVGLAKLLMVLAETTTGLAVVMSTVAMAMAISTVLAVYRERAPVLERH